MPLDEIRELPELGLAIRTGLQVERLRRVRVEQDVVAPAHAVENETERLGQTQGILETDVAAAGQHGLPRLARLHRAPV